MAVMIVLGVGAMAEMAEMTFLPWLQSSAICFNSCIKCMYKNGFGHIFNQTIKKAWAIATWYLSAISYVSINSFI